MPSPPKEAPLEAENGPDEESKVVEAHDGRHGLDGRCRCRLAFLGGLKKTWLTSMETQKKLGHIEDYKIFRSDLFMSGEFNMMLVVKFKSTADLAPNKAKYEAFMKEWGEAPQMEARDLSQKSYSTMRKITGQCDFREVTLK
jgi:hypothetical protein